MRRASVVLLGSALVVFWCSVGWTQETKKKVPRYVGVAKCKMCHKGSKKGEQFEKWQSSKHAKAYAVLGTPEAQTVAKKAGIEGDPQKSPACLKCHVTAYDVDPKRIAPSFKAEDGVQCETCHGPGSEYKRLKVMKDRAAALKAGLILPDEKLCVTCHNEKSPSYKKFVFKERVEKIAHPKPKKKAKPQE